MQEPRASGYRAIHLIVKQDGFLIEVQLRTQTTHQWASDAEAFSALFGENYKQDGDSVIQEFLRLRALLENTPDDAHKAADVSTFTALAQKVRSMLKGLPNESEEVNDE
ncbi:hypothetical protein [Schaalia canis]|uniref:RelA/SpoT domain-containing protein n=1 Tax=Schaalia canis TaxID=100469 RepID=A0A3P1SHC2_9ACTO|nr:hypothetical protein EII11_04790 [Schaalia canis]